MTAGRRTRAHRSRPGSLPPAAATPAPRRTAAAAIRTGFRYVRRVQFAETDLAGVVHFSWYLRYIEEAEHALWREAGLSIVPRDHAVGFPRVSLSIDYHAPLHFEDIVDVWIRLTGLSARTLSYATTLACGDAIVATATHTAVCVDPRARPMRSTALPSDIRERLEAFRGERPL